MSIEWSALLNKIMLNVSMANLENENDRMTARTTPAKAEHSNTKGDDESMDLDLGEDFDMSSDSIDTVEERSD